jgi:hypothetical protein
VGTLKGYSNPEKCNILGGKRWENWIKMRC